MGISTGWSEDSGSTQVDNEKRAFYSHFSEPLIAAMDVDIDIETQILLSPLLLAAFRLELSKGEIFLVPSRCIYMTP